MSKFFCMKSARGRTKVTARLSRRTFGGAGIGLHGELRQHKIAIGRKTRTIVRQAIIRQHLQLERGDAFKFRARH